MCACCSGCLVLIGLRGYVTSAALLPPCSPLKKKCNTSLFLVVTVSSTSHAAASVVSCCHHCTLTWCGVDCDNARYDSNTSPKSALRQWGVCTIDLTNIFLFLLPGSCTTFKSTSSEKITSARLVDVQLGGRKSVVVLHCICNCG